MATSTSVPLARSEELAGRRWPEVDGTSLLAIPLGACEQHGPHLPLGTDTVVAAALVDALAASRPGVLAAPALPYGASGEHGGFPGTLSIGTAVLTAVVVELVRSADAFAGTVLVSGHGGNAEALATADATLRAEGRRVLLWWPTSAVASAAGGRQADLHAGWVETSVVLALAPATVDLEAASAGDVRPLGALLGTLRRVGVAAVSPNGVLGDPAGASAALGRAVLRGWVEDLVSAVDRWAAAGPAGVTGPEPAVATAASAATAATAATTAARAARAAPGRAQ